MITALGVVAVLVFLALLAALIVAATTATIRDPDTRFTVIFVACLLLGSLTGVALAAWFADRILFT